MSVNKAKKNITFHEICKCISLKKHINFQEIWQCISLKKLLFKRFGGEYIKQIQFNCKKIYQNSMHNIYLMNNGKNTTN